MIRHDKGYSPKKKVRLATTDEAMEATETVGKLAAKIAAFAIERKAPNNVVAAAAMMVAADELMARAITLYPDILEAARVTFRARLKMENP